MFTRNFIACFLVTTGAGTTGAQWVRHETVLLACTVFSFLIELTCDEHQDSLIKNCFPILHTPDIIVLPDHMMMGYLLANEL